MKKILIAILTLTMLICCGCGQSGQNSDSDFGSSGGQTSTVPPSGDSSGASSDDGVIHLPEVPVN